MNVICILNFCLLFLNISFVIISKDGVISKEQINDDFFKNLDNLEAKKKYLQIIDICSDVLKSKTDYYNEIDLLIRLGDANFEISEYKKAISIYKTLLNRYDDFVGRDDVLYNLCKAIYKLMPVRPDIDLEYCNKMVNYGNYALEKITNIDYKKEIMNMVEEAKNTIKDKEFNEIEFYYKYKKYNSALYCCNKFIENYSNDKDLPLYMYMKAKILYKINIRFLDLIKNNKGKLSNITLKEIYEKLIKNYNELVAIKSKSLASDYGEDILDIIDDFENKMSS